MLHKAQNLITAVKKREALQLQGKPIPESNPFRKGWGLQKDGDIWQIAWEAVLKRTATNQQLRKVKGHATAKEIKEGTSTKKDRKAMIGVINSPTKESSQSKTPGSYDWANG